MAFRIDIHDDATKQRQYAEGAAAVMRPQLEAAGIEVNTDDPFRIEGMYNAAVSLGRIGAHNARADASSQGGYFPRLDGFDAVRIGNERADVQIAPDGTPSATATVEETLTSLEEQRQAEFAKQANRWKKGVRALNDPNHDPSMPVNKSSIMQRGATVHAPPPGNTPRIAPESTEHAQARSFPDAEFNDPDASGGTDLDADEAFAAGNGAAAAMKAKQETAWQQPRRRAGGAR